MDGITAAPGVKIVCAMDSGSPLALKQSQESFMQEQTHVQANLVRSSKQDTRSSSGVSLREQASQNWMSKRSLFRYDSLQASINSCVKSPGGIH